MGHDPARPRLDVPTPRRVAWIDDARGIGILLVVVGHVLRGLKSAGILNDAFAFRFVDGWIYAFHMPLFFILSGLFAERKSRLEPRRFLIDQAATIIYPYFLWSTIQTCIQMALSGSVNKAVGFGDLWVIPTTPVMQFWFLYALFLIACVQYGLRRLGLPPSATLVFFAIAWATSQLHPEFLPWFPLLSGARHGIYYALGSAANLRDRAVAAILQPGPSAAIMVVGYAIVTIWMVWSPKHLPTPIQCTGALIAALSGSAATIALAMLTQRTSASQVLSSWGRASLSIFVAHTIFSAATRIVLIKVFKTHSPTIHIVLGTIGGLAPPLLLAYLSESFPFPYLFRWPIRKRSAANPET